MDHRQAGTTPPARAAVSRRRFLTSAAALTGAAALGGFVGFEAAMRQSPSAADATAAGPATFPFDGVHQAGIVTRPRTGSRSRRST